MLAIDELRLTIPGAVDLVVAEPSVIRAALDVLYSPASSHPRLTDEVEDDEPAEDASMQPSIDVNAELDAPAVEEVNRLLGTQSRSARPTSTSRRAAPICTFARGSTA